MSERNIEIVREYNFDPKEVIKGLNGYYESDKCNSYITIRRNGVQTAYLTTTLYLSALIEWLREDFDIFYRPGMTLDQVEAATRALKAEEEVKKLKEQLDKAAADYQALSEENQKLKNAEKSDTNKLIREYCTEHGIIAPSRYISDEACVEYLFSVIDLKQKDRSFTILQDLYRDIFKRQPGGLSAEDIANKILDKVLETDSPAAQRGKTRAEIENYKLKLKDYILKDIKKHGYRYDGLETKSIEEIVDWIITMATSDHSFIVLKDIYTAVAAPVERLRYRSCDGPTVDHMKEYILKRFEDLRINTEYCLRKMSELDGCQKDLKILEEQQEFLVKQNSELATKVGTKDDEISRLKGLINAMNEEVRDM